LNFFPLPQGQGSLRPTFAILMGVFLSGTEGTSRGGRDMVISPELMASIEVDPSVKTKFELF
jgi:hypothetical protein